MNNFLGILYLIVLVAGIGGSLQPTTSPYYRFGSIALFVEFAIIGFKLWLASEIH